MHLSASEFEQFHRVQSALNNFIYAQLQRAEGREAVTPFRDLPFTKQMEVRNAFLANPHHVERFVVENPQGLSAQDLEVALSWRNPLSGNFYIVKHLKKHTVFLSASDPPVAYGVVGLTQPIEEVLPEATLPIMVEAILLSIGGKIVYDGLLNAVNVTIGTGLKRELNESYRSAKERGVIASLSAADDGAPVIEATKKSARPRKKKVAAKANSSAYAVQAEPTGVYQFCLTLTHTEPAIWRRIQVEDCTLELFHAFLQTAMGWENSHLHEFLINGQRCGVPEMLQAHEIIDSTQTHLSDFLGETRPFTFQYVYDFGDTWEHAVEFEGFAPREDRAVYPRCVEGEGACPPEDCGGPYGYMNFVQAMSDRTHPDHADLREWYGRKFDPDSFKPAQVTKAMRTCLRYWQTAVDE